VALKPSLWLPDGQVCGFLMERAMEPNDITHGATSEDGETAFGAAQRLRIHARRLVDTAERMLAQAEAELEAAKLLITSAAVQPRTVTPHP
jgi:hypothetical protein